MKLRKGSWNRHSSTILEEYCAVMGYDPLNATRIGKFFCCPEDEPPPSPNPSDPNEKTKICVMLIEEDVVSLPGLSWSKSRQAWRSSFLDLESGEIKFQYFPVDKSQNLTEEVQRIRVFDFKMRNVEEAKAWRKQYGYSAKQPTSITQSKAAILHPQYSTTSNTAAQQPQHQHQILHQQMSTGMGHLVFGERATKAPKLEDGKGPELLLSEELGASEGNTL